jgi:RHS repeat-associated protein
MLAEYSGGAWIDYVWLNGRLIGRVAGGQRYAIHDDQVGRPEAVTDGSGAVVWRAQNFAFTQNVTTAGIVLNLGFPGQYYDAETSAWNNGFRDYKSALGRYVESDPIGLDGGINTYAYVSDDPLIHTDLMGLCDDSKWHFNGLFLLKPSINASFLAAYGGGLAGTKSLYGDDPDDISITTPAYGLSASADVTLISIKYQGTATQSPINIDLGGTAEFHDILGGSITLGYHPPATFEFSVTAGGGLGAGFKSFQVGADISH